MGDYCKCLKKQRLKKNELPKQKSKLIIKK